MFGKSAKKQKERMKRKKIYDRVYAIHENARFLCYIDDAYEESYNGVVSVKLEGVVAIGVGCLSDTFLLFDCEGKQKATVTMEELYVGRDSVDRIEGGEKRVALYPKEQQISYRAGDLLCIF